MLKRIPLPVFGLLSFLLLISGCAWERRSDLRVPHYSEPLSLRQGAGPVVFFEPSIPGRSLDETVWDNVQGPFWDARESGRIGFTQNYKAQFFLTPPVLLPFEAKRGKDLTNTRIMIPFGNLFSSYVVSVLERHYPNLRVCFDAACVASSGSSEVLKLRIDQFTVWEEPLNHINFHLKCSGELSEGGKVLKQHDLVKGGYTRKLGGVFNTHRQLIARMNDHANEFTQQAAAELLTWALAA